MSEQLAAQLADLSYLRIPENGRGRALKASWGESPMDIVSYMDVDLSTDLSAFPPLIQAIAEEGYDIAIGTRRAAGSQVRRSLSREVLSQGYNLLIKAMFRARFSDAQCGFKAADRSTAQRLIPLVEDGNWFFDTEFLIIAEKAGLRIKEIPVRWREDPDTRVHVGRTVWEDVQGLVRLRLGRPWRRSKPAR